MRWRHLEGRVDDPSRRPVDSLPVELLLFSFPIEPPLSVPPLSVPPPSATPAEATPAEATPASAPSRSADTPAEDE